MKHVTFHLPSFLRRVRIHGGEFDSSARAMNRVSEKGSLMTYERAFTAQAEPRIVRGSTIERKQMSTKTTIKRIALVSVAALGFGVLSVVPSNAAIGADTFVLSSATASQTTAETATATSSVATVSFLGSIGDSVSVTASLVSGPGAAFPYLSLTETASAKINAADPAVGETINPNTAVHVQAGSASAFAVAKFRVYLAQGTSATTAPTTAGTYVVKLTPASVGQSGALQAAAAVTLTITVTAAPALDKVVSATASTSILNKGETNTATADATGITGDMTLPTSNTAAVATIATTLKNAAGITQTGESYTAIITAGPGLLGSGAFTNETTAYAAAGRAILVQHNHFVGIFPDGTSGKTTVEIRTAAGALISTKSVTFHGAIAKIVPTIAKATVGTSATDAITAIAYDKDGTVVSAGNLYAITDSATIMATSAATSLATGSATFSLTGLVAGTANFTIGDAATVATSKVTAVAGAIRVGSNVPASVSVSFDKASYAPGEKITASVTLLDARGLTVSDGVYTNIFATGGISANYTTGISDTTSVTTVSGVGTLSGFLPSTEGDVVFKWTTGSTAAAANTGLATANQKVAGTATVSVSSPSSAAATDAANEARDAADAATDAALQAAEAADAATVAAQEASDAVAALSESVTALVAGLQAQIKSLAAVLQRIAKKVKA